jgi:hypothetical protein
MPLTDTFCLPSMFAAVEKKLTLCKGSCPPDLKCAEFNTGINQTLPWHKPCWINGVIANGDTGNHFHQPV